MQDVKEYDKEFENFGDLGIDLTEFIHAQSASPTIIFKGIIKNTQDSVFCKICYYKRIKIDPQFYQTIDEKALVYEGNVYNHIKQFPVNDNKFFIETAGFGKIKFFKLFSYLQTKFSNDVFDQIKAKARAIYDIPMFGNNQDNNDELYILCTRDYNCTEQSCTLITYLDKQNRLDIRTAFINTLTVFILIIRSIYILNNKFKIIHNDMHFKNILIYDNRPEKYIIYEDTKEIIYVNAPFTIKIYDFDNSYIEGKPNPVLNTNLQDRKNLWKCREIGFCNDMTNHDNFLFLNILISMTQDNIHPYLNDLYNKVIEIFVPKDKLNHIRNNIQKGMHFNTYCHDWTSNSDCPSGRESNKRYFDYADNLYIDFLKWAINICSINNCSNLIQVQPVQQQTLQRSFQQPMQTYVYQTVQPAIQKSIGIPLAIPDSKDETMETPPPSDESMGVQPGQTQMLNKYLKYKNKYIKLKASNKLFF